MNQAGLLETIAEVAVAFVGFAGLASIFGRRFSKDEPAVQEERLRGMIHCGLTAVAFAFVPFVIDGAGITGESTWRVSSALLGITFLAVTVAMLVRSRRAGVGLGPHPGLAVAVVLMATTLVGSQILNASGFFQPRASHIYVCGLLVVLAITAMFFTRLLSTFSLTHVD